MSTTRIGFSTSKNVVSRAIRWFTKSKTSHAFLVYHDEDWDRDMVMEATAGGFRIVPFDKFSAQNTVVAVIAPKHSIETGLKKAVDWLGEHFDYTGLLGMAMVVVGRWLRLKLRNPFAASNSMFCSEAVSRVLRWSDYPGTQDMEPEDTSPEDLLEFLGKETLGLA